MTLYGRSFLTLLDYTPDEIRHLLDLAKRLKREKHLRIGHRHLMGRNIVLLFEKTSTRTRCAFEVAGRDLGMGVTFLDPVSSQMGKKESIEDTARVLGRMYDGIEYRGFSQNTVELLAKYSGVPVWNGLTDQFHPTQMLADLLTIEEQLGRLERRVAAVLRDVRLRARQADLAGIVQRHADPVAQRNGLHHHVDGVVAVLPPADDVQRKIDFCICVDFDNLQSDSPLYRLKIEKRRISITCFGHIS